jgi:predicted nuclease with TOPRIM domain
VKNVKYIFWGIVVIFCAINSGWSLSKICFFCAISRLLFIGIADRLNIQHKINSLEFSIIEKELSIVKTDLSTIESGVQLWLDKELINAETKLSNAKSKVSELEAERERLKVELDRLDSDCVNNSINETSADHFVKSNHSEI